MNAGFYIGILFPLLFLEVIAVVYLPRIANALERIESLLEEKKGGGNNGRLPNVGHI